MMDYPDAITVRKLITLLSAHDPDDVVTLNGDGGAVLAIEHNEAISAILMVGR